MIYNNTILCHPDENGFPLMPDSLQGFFLKLYQGLFQVHILYPVFIYFFELNIWFSKRQAYGEVHIKEYSESALVIMFDDQSITAEGFDKG